MPFVLFHLLFSMLEQHSEICPKIVLLHALMASPAVFVVVVLLSLIFNQSESYVIKGTIFHNTLKKGQHGHISLSQTSIHVPLLHLH